MAKYNFLTLDTAPLVAEAREFAQAQGKPVGSIGRVSVDVLADYFLSQPKTLRELADFLGADIPAKGRVSKEKVKEIAASIR